MKNSLISWCDHTFSPWSGCQKVSDGCKYCYAEKLVGPSLWGPNGQRRQHGYDYWQQPDRWQEQALRDGRRSRVFCAELANKRRGETAEKEGLKTRAFDLRTGEAIWEITGGDPIQFSEEHDLLVTPHGIYQGKDGTRLHDGIAAGQIAGGQLISGTTDSFTVYDLRTGDRQGEELKWYRRGCTDL